MKKKLIQENKIYVIMYHYVREINKSNYPNLKGLEYKLFVKQINYFLKKFNILSYENFVEIINKKKIPKKPSILLTFDDGYLDHYEYVFPFLNKKKVEGIFYPPKKAIENKTVLDVNKIHFILEKEQNRKKILNEIINDLKKENLIKYLEKNLENINTHSRFDDKETVMIKRLLQHFLPSNMREKILNSLFKKIVNEEINQFSKKLYMNKNHIKEMSKNNMTFGSHGTYHKWLEYLDFSQQKKEIKESLNFLKKNTFQKEFSFCYPYGSYNKNTLKILKRLKINFSFTTSPGFLSKNNIKDNLYLPRFDTNDFL